MAKKSMILKQQAEPKFSSRRYNRCKICGRPMLTCGITAYAVSASGSWPTRVRSPVSARPAGKVRSNPNVKKIQRVPGRWLRVRAERIPRIPLGLHG